MTSKQKGKRNKGKRNQYQDPKIIGCKRARVPRISSFSSKKRIKWEGGRGGPERTQFSSWSCMFFLCCFFFL